MNGVCLTVETFGQGWFTAYASAETMSVTNLGELRVSSTVNLERALALGDRLGRHRVGPRGLPGRGSGRAPGGQVARLPPGLPRDPRPPRSSPKAPWPWTGSA
ncbi:hypothetical protein MASR2M17_23570 [Aminivibrio sp.]